MSIFTSSWTLSSIRPRSLNMSSAVIDCRALLEVIRVLRRVGPSNPLSCSGDVIRLSSAWALTECSQRLVFAREVVKMIDLHSNKVTNLN